METVIFLFNANIHIKEDSPGIGSFTKTLFVFCRQVLEMKVFTYEDKTQIDQSNMNFQQKCYVNPRVALIHHHPKTFLIESDNPGIALICEFLYKYFTNENLDVQEQSLSLFKAIIERLGDKVGTYFEHFLKIYESFIVKIINNKIYLNFGLINHIFESFAALIKISSSQPSSAQLLIPVLSQSTQLFSKNECDLHAVILQIFCVFIQSFKIQVIPQSNPAQPQSQGMSLASNLFQQSSLGEFINFCLEVNNYNGEFIICAEVYLQVIGICSRYAPNIITQFWDKISNVLQNLIQKKLHLIILKFIQNLIIMGNSLPCLLQFMVNYLEHMMNLPVNNETLIELQIFYRETLITLLTFLEIQTINQFFTKFSEINGIETLKKFFSQQMFIQLVQSFGLGFQRKYMVVGFSTLLFGNYQQAVTALTLDVYKNLINSVATNVFARKINRKSLKNFRTENKEYDDQIKNLSGGAFRKIYIFKELKPEWKTHLANVTVQMYQNKIMEDPYFLQKLMEFSQGSGVSMDQILSPENCMRFTEYNNNNNKVLNA
jgi:hypothetical protein